MQQAVGSGKPARRNKTDADNMTQGVDSGGEAAAPQSP